MSSSTPVPAGHATAAPPFDPLDMRNYGLEKLKDIAAGPWMARAKLVGVPLGLLAFFYFHLKWCGPISFYDAAEVKNISHLYTVTGIFAFSLILWMTEALPSYLTSFMIIVSTILLGIMPMRATFAYLGEPVMVLNIASFILASALVVTGLAKRIALKLVLKWGNNLAGIFWAFIALNMILGAFISATSAKTALLLPLFMVISAMYGAFGGAVRNNVGRNMVLQNLLANNVSASAFITGSAANLLAAQLLERLERFERRALESRIGVEEPGAIRVEADVTQRQARRREAAGHSRRKPLRKAGHRVALERDRGAREVKRAQRAVADHLDHVGVEEQRDVVDRVGGGGDRAVGRRGESLGHRTHERRRDQGLVALHVDDDLRVAQPEPSGRLGEAVSARGVVGAGHDRLEAGRRHRVGDALRIGRHGDPRGAGRRCAFGDAHHHRFAADVGERLVGQPRRREPRRDERDEVRHG